MPSPAGRLQAAACAASSRLTLSAPLAALAAAGSPPPAPSDSSSSALAAVQRRRAQGSRRSDTHGGRDKKSQHLTSSSCRASLSGAPSWTSPRQSRRPAAATAGLQPHAAAAAAHATSHAAAAASAAPRALGDAAPIRTVMSAAAPGARDSASVRTPGFSRRREPLRGSLRALGGAARQSVTQPLCSLPGRNSRGHSAQRRSACGQPQQRTSQR
jgi:hypothetical protein